MAARWVIAFSLAAWLALIGSASLRQRARAQRGQRDADVRQRRLRFLGGPVLAIATLAGWLASPSLPVRLGVTAAAAAAVVLFGVIDDRRELPGLAHLAVFAAAAIAVAAAGVRLDQLHSGALDGILTVVWIVIVTSAFRRLEYAEGLTPATAALASAGLFGAAAASHDNVTATMCVALAGGCLGLLVYNARPASIVPGRAGASFAGFVLATAGVAFKPDTVTTGSLIVPLLVVTVPVLDLALVTASRLWHGIPLSRPRHDHLMHRLRARGWSRTRAMGVLLVVQAVLTVVAVLVGRGDVSPVWGFALGAGVAGALVVASLEVSTEHMRARRRTPRRHPSRRSRVRHRGQVVRSRRLVAGRPPRLAGTNDSGRRREPPSRPRALRRRGRHRPRRATACPRVQHEAAGRRRDGERRRGSATHPGHRSGNEAPSSGCWEHQQPAAALPAGSRARPRRQGRRRAHLGGSGSGQRGGGGQSHTGGVRGGSPASLLPRRAEQRRAACDGRDDRQLGSPHGRQWQGHARPDPADRPPRSRRGVIGARERPSHRQRAVRFHSTVRAFLP